MERALLVGCVAVLSVGLLAAQDPGEELERLRREAEAARAAARAAVEKFEMLATVVQLRDAEERAKELFPAWPENVPAMQAWLEDAATLVDRRGPIERALAEIRARAISAAEGGRRFAAAADQFLHDTLCRLSEDLAKFLAEKGTFRDVQTRLDWARRVQKASIGERSNEWRAAIAAIARSPVYRGLELDPQVGLLPIGPDPQSGLWEFAQLRSGVAPKRDGATGGLQIGEDTGAVFVLLPGGSFRMGSQMQDPAAANYDPQARVDEAPVHEVELSPFFLSKYEVTRGQWRRLTGENTAPETDEDTRPVEGVSWNRSQETLSRHGLTLPTEAQWEYACRAGTATPFWTGAAAESLQGAANLADRSARRQGATGVSEDWLDDGFAGLAPVGSYRPNPFGLFDMHGNVGEWCSDPVMVGEGRAVRGGSFGAAAAGVRSAARSNWDPEHRDSRIGVRPARAVR